MLCNMQSFIYLYIKLHLRKKKTNDIIDSMKTKNSKQKQKNLNTKQSIRVCENDINT